ncbi:thiamine-phosphate kinase [Opitutaceae bacterium]
MIAQIQRWLGAATPRTPFGIGDDCAVVPASRHTQLVTVDPVIYGEHFDDAIPPRAAGAKLLKRNLSDIAAMGGRPRAAVIALALDGRVKTVWLEGFYRGLAAEARRFGVPIVGGDVARQGGGIVATLTLIGEAAGRRVLTRHGARRGDWIYVTGSLGGSIRGHHHRFTPRLKEGAWLAARAEVRSLMDVSDGIARDIRALTPTGCSPQIMMTAVPVSVAARAESGRTGRTALDHALSDGEDYELLFTVSERADCARFEAAWKRAFSTRLSCIGRMTATSAPVPTGAVDLTHHHGYEHLQA